MGATLVWCVAQRRSLLVLFFRLDFFRDVETDTDRGGRCFFCPLGRYSFTERLLSERQRHETTQEPINRPCEQPCRKPSYEPVPNKHRRAETTQFSEGTTTTTMVEEQHIIREMAETCNAILKLHEGRLGDVARGIGGTLLSPPLELSDVQKYLEEIKGFPEFDNLLET